MNDENTHNANIFFIDGTNKNISFIRQNDNDHGINLHPNKDGNEIIFIPYSSIKFVILTE